MRAFLAATLFAGSVHAALLPGFRAQLVGSTAGFASSLAIDSRGTIYYTTTTGNIFRFQDGQSRLVAHVNTVAIGNSGLLGLALRDDNTAVLHYTTPGQVADVISDLDLTTGVETIVHSFICDKDLAWRGSPPEHHGGNPYVAADGSIFVGIGDYGGGLIASLPEWNGGKIFRIFPDGSVQQFARGFRNPFDMAWDDAHQRLIVPDNGVLADDEINIVHLGDSCGWPFTMGNGPTIDGDLAPIYVFPTIVAPTGFIALSGRNSMFQRGYLLGAFVTKALYYIPDIDARPLQDPIAILEREVGPVIDVAEDSRGEIYIATGSAIYQLIVPLRGDCNGDGRIDVADFGALQQELTDGDSQSMFSAQNGGYRGSWGCDVNGDGLIDTRDMTELLSMISLRGRAVRRGSAASGGQ